MASRSRFLWLPLVLLISSVTLPGSPAPAHYPWIVQALGRSDRQAAETGPFRPPAVPLVTHDPYFSIWSMADRLTDDWPRHWTGKTHALSALVRIDGEAFRLMGSGPARVPAAAQTGLTVTPTKTTYIFKQSGIDLALEFLTPQIITDLELLSRPVTYVLISARSADGRTHAVSVYFDASPEIAVDETSQKVVWSRLRLAVLSYRQSLAAHKLAADIDGTPLLFPKENFSNGCISTVDVIYPEAPMYLLMNPMLMRGLVIPVLEYARGPEWKFPFAPHDLGTYPKANGQAYGDDRRNGGGLRRFSRPGLPLDERDARPGAADGLVLDP